MIVSFKRRSYRALTLHSKILKSIPTNIIKKTATKIHTLCERGLP